MCAITNIFNNAINELMALARHVGTNDIPDGISFVKCYDVSDALSTGFSLSLYEHTCFLERERVASAQIIADLISFQQYGPYVSLVDLELYFISDIDVVILVKLIFSQQKCVMDFHVCIPMAGNNSNNISKFNLNDYANELANRYQKKET